MESEIKFIRTLDEAFTIYTKESSIIKIKNYKIENQSNSKYNIIQNNDTVNATENDATENDATENDATENDDTENDATENDDTENDATENDDTENDDTENDDTENDNTENDDKYDDDKYDDLNIVDFQGIKHGDIVNAYGNIYIFTFNSGFIRISDENKILYKSISKYIEDPITFYKTNYNYDYFDIIELSTNNHMKLLRKYCNADKRNIVIAKTIKFVYKSKNSSIVFTTAKLYEGGYHKLKLTTNIDECYLSNKSFNDYDPITIKANQKYWVKVNQNYKKNVNKVFKIGKELSIYLSTPINNTFGFNKIKDIKYNEDGSPSEIIINYSSGIYGIDVQDLIFLPYYNKYIGIPEWMCKTLIINPECKYFKNPFKYKLFISEYNFNGNRLY
jgi:hypothetical protein